VTHYCPDHDPPPLRGYDRDRHRGRRFRFETIDFTLRGQPEKRVKLVQIDEGADRLIYGVPWSGLDTYTRKHDDRRGRNNNRAAANHNIKQGKVRRESVYDAIVATPNITIRELEVITGFSNSCIRDHITRLHNDDRIRPTVRRTERGHQAPSLWRATKEANHHG
jgi:hypothetical protein